MRARAASLRKLEAAGFTRAQAEAILLSRAGRTATKANFAELKTDTLRPARASSGARACSGPDARCPWPVNGPYGGMQRSSGSIIRFQATVRTGTSPIVVFRLLPQTTRRSPSGAPRRPRPRHRPPWALRESGIRLLLQPPGGFALIGSALLVASDTTGEDPWRGVWRSRHWPECFSDQCCAAWLS